MGHCCTSPFESMAVLLQSNGQSYGDPLRGAYQPVPTVAPESTRTNLVSREIDPPPSCVARFFRGDFTIVPEHNYALDTWDVIVIASLLITAVLDPFEVALVQEPGGRLYVLGQVIDCIFIVDVVLTFNIGYFVADKGAGNIQVLEQRPFCIMRRYLAFPFSENFLAGWFWPDV